MVYNHFTTIYPPLKEFEFPERSATVVLHSLVEQFSKARVETPLSGSFLLQANSSVIDDTPSAAPPIWVSGGFLPDPRTFLSAVYDLSPDSVPGYPHSLVYRNKLEFVVDNLTEVYEAVMLRILSLHYLWDDEDSALERLVKHQQGFVTVTVKNEPIKIGKAPRLVFPTDVVDELIERCARTPHYDSMKRSWGEFYSCIGLGFSEIDSDIIFSGLDPSVQLCSNDSPKFDMTRTLLEESLDNEVMFAAYRDVHPKVRVIIERASRCSLRSLFVLPCGLLVEQFDYTGMKSGRNATSMGNTIARSRRAQAVDDYLREHYDLSHRTLTRAAGDDCVESYHKCKESVYVQLGFVLRDFVVLPEGRLEFCSHDWSLGERPVGQRAAKSLAKFLCGDRSDDQVSSFLTAYSNHPDYRVLASIALASRSGANLINFSKMKASTNKQTKSRSRRARLRGNGDYDESTLAIVKPMERLEKKIDHIERSMFKPPKVSQVAGGIGRAIGSRFGAGDLGAQTGSGLARLFGMGDYSLKSNSLIKGGLSGPVVPKFGSERRAIRIAEREFVATISSGALSNGSSVFNNQVFNINPTDPGTFPWLSAIANKFDGYIPHGIVFEFVSTSSEYNGTSQALGKVVMATDYDSTDRPYASAQEAENSDYACVTKPSNSLVHGIECDPDDRPMRVLYTGTSTGTSPLFSSVGNFQISTSGCSTANAQLGELWVSYDISFLKKQVVTVGNDNAYLCLTGSATNAGPWFSPNNVTASRGITIAVVVATGNRIMFPPNQGSGRYVLTAKASAFGVGDEPFATLFNCSSVNYELSTQTAGVNTMWVRVVDVTAPGAYVQASLKFTTSNVGVTVTSVPDDFTFSD